MRPTALVAWLVTAVVLAVPASAQAGEVFVEEVISHDIDGAFLVYKAWPGERNTVHANYGNGGAAIHVQDSAGVKAHDGCVSAGPAAADCTIRSEHYGDVWRLGDGDDALDLDGDVGPNTGDPSIFGGTGADVIHGSSDSDDIYDGSGDDHVFGGGGDDVLWSGAGGDDLSGGDGSDTVSYDSFDDVRDLGVHADLDGEADDGWADEHDRIRRDVENLDGSEHADVLRGDGRPNALDGGFGNDRVFGMGGDDVIDARLGADIVDLGRGHDRVQGGQLVRARDGASDRIAGCKVAIADRLDLIFGCGRVRRR
jgi:Ca2+-binding RTX toxin-like protein